MFVIYTYEHIEKGKPSIAVDGLLIRECKFSLIKLILQQPFGCTTGVLTKFAKSNKITKHIIPTDSSSCLTTRQVSVGKGVKAYGKSKSYDQNKSHD